MPGYISEIDYFGTSDQEFVEIAVPAGTDVSSYTLVFYETGGSIYNTVSLGSYTGTFGGHDVYVVDQATPGFDSGGDSMGTFYADDAVALVDGDGNVLQFMSWEGNTVTATEGPANGTTSNDEGTQTDSLQSDNGGSSYYAQSTSNKGTIPACYAPGTLIETPEGPRRVETLRVGDEIWTADDGSQTIRWIWDGTTSLEDMDDDGFPVLIQAGSFGVGLPHNDLIVSPQHRILLGGDGALSELFKQEVFVPAKALTMLSGVRFMRGKRAARWLHFSCDRHSVVRANGCLSESLLIGPMVLRNLPHPSRKRLRRLYGQSQASDVLNGPLARVCLTVGEAKRCLSLGRRNWRDIKNLEVIWDNRTKPPSEMHNAEITAQRV